MRICAVALISVWLALFEPAAARPCSPADLCDVTIAFLTTARAHTEFEAGVARYAKRGTTYTDCLRRQSKRACYLSQVATGLTEELAKAFVASGVTEPARHSVRLTALPPLVPLRGHGSPSTDRKKRRRCLQPSRDASALSRSRRENRIGPRQSRRRVSGIPFRRKMYIQRAPKRPLSGAQRLPRQRSTAASQEPIPPRNRPCLWYRSQPRRKTSTLWALLRLRLQIRNQGQRILHADGSVGSNPQKRMLKTRICEGILPPGRVHDEARRPLRVRARKQRPPHPRMLDPHRPQTPPLRPLVGLRNLQPQASDIACPLQAK